MKSKYLFALVVMFLMMVGCQSKTEQWRNPNECDFISESNTIKVNYELSYDIIPRATYGLKTARESDVGVELDIFNYGGKLRINRYAIENIYSSMLAPISHFYVVSLENISITNTLYDETYGKWGKGRVIIPEFNRQFEDVFISPLAYNYMQKGQNTDDNCLVLVRLISPSNNCTFNGVFYGNNLTEWIINSNYHHIVTHNTSFNTDNCGESWTPLLSNEEHNIYKNYMLMFQMGLDPGFYELPNTIVEKISR